MKYQISTKEPLMKSIQTTEIPDRQKKITKLPNTSRVISNSYLHTKASDKTELN
jgi:hypothetical protein